METDSYTVPGQAGPTRFELFAELERMADAIEALSVKATELRNPASYAGMGAFMKARDIRAARREVLARVAELQAVAALLRLADETARESERPE